MSQEGYEKLVAELRRLESIERPKASAAIADARDKRLEWKFGVRRG